MLRKLVFLVLVLNALLAGAIWAVHTGQWVWPDAWRGESHEPERLAHQVHPEAIVLKPNSSISNAPVVKPAASAPVVAAAEIKQLCLQSAGNDAAIANKLSAALKDVLPAAVNLQVVKSSEGGMWMVYMGKYADINAATKKMDEVKKLKIPGDFALIRNTEALRPGISLGTFRERERAEARLEEVGKKGVKTARVVEVNSPRVLSNFRLPELDPVLRDKAAEAVLKAGGNALEVCPAV